MGRLNATPASCLALTLGVLVSACTTSRYAGAIATPTLAQQLSAETHIPTLEADVTLHPGPPSPESPRSQGLPPFRSQATGKLVTLDDRTATLQLDRPGGSVGPASVPPLLVPVADVRTLRASDRRAGTVQGMGVGALTALGLGLLVYAQNRADNGGGIGFFSPAEAGLVTAAAALLPAVLLGAVLGHSNGRTTEYQFGAIPPP